MPLREAMYYEKLDEGKVRCLLCPRGCRIAPGKKGFCLGRVNEGGSLYAASYARATSAAVDPIEKKPLYHFHPGRGIFSIGTYGCNFACEFCQNFSISQREAPTDELPPEEVVRLAKGSNSVGVAYTYNEPLIWFEYVLDTSRLARGAGLVNVLVTNGYVNEEPLRELLPLVDALNVDLKGDEEFYSRLCKGDPEPVRKTCRLAREAGAHLEVTHLVIPGWNDGEEKLEELSSWVAAELGEGTPVHLSAYFPRHKLQARPTPAGTLGRAREVFLRRLRYVYLGNILSREGADTHCASCKALLVERAGYRVRVTGLAPDGKCSSCGAGNGFTV